MPLDCVQEGRITAVVRSIKPDLIAARVVKGYVDIPIAVHGVLVAHGRQAFAPVVATFAAASTKEWYITFCLALFRNISGIDCWESDRADADRSFREGGNHIGQLGRAMLQEEARITSNLIPAESLGIN